MNDVKVTILMPAYNAEKYIAEAIRSVLLQTFTEFELLIINDGSTDTTVNIIHQFNDPRIRLIHQNKQGICTALNNGLQKANGKYIARFDADDICLPDRLQKQTSFLDNNPGYVLTGSDAEYIAENGNHLFNFSCIGHSDEDIIKALPSYCPFIHSSVMYRKETVVNAGGYNPLARTFEDYFLWIQLTKMGRSCNLPEQLIKVRFNPYSSTIDEKWRGRQFRQLKKAIIKRGIITEKESKQLADIIESQDINKFRLGAYNALCGKKFLVDNYQPAKARWHLSRSIAYHPLRLDNYALYILSFFPRTFLRWLQKIS